MWTCLNCAEQNDDNSSSCEICAGRRPPTEPAPRPAASARPETPATSPPAPAVAPFSFAPADEIPSGRRTIPAVWLLAGTLVLLTALGVGAAIVVPRLFDNSDGPQFDEGAAPAATVTADPATEPPVTEDTVTPTVTPTDDPTTTAPPTASGIVTIGPAVTDERALDVATMFDTYFGGINAKDYGAVGSVLDPAGSIDPNDPAQMRAVADGTRTTQDSGVALVLLEDAGAGLLRAEVTFQSAQAAGDGPRGRSSETCTSWDIVYTVTTGDAYRIKKSKATSSPC